MIQTFKEFNSEGYEEISLSEYRKYYIGSGFDNIDTIKEKELLDIKSLLSEMGTKDVAIIEVYQRLNAPSANCINIYTVYGKKRAINIDKLHDEWYLIIIEEGWPVHNMISTISDKAYKCDQIDGLLSCIKYIYDELNKWKI